MNTAANKAINSTPLCSASYGRRYAIFMDNVGCVLICSMVQLKVQMEVRIMVKVPEIVPVTDLRQDAAAVLKRLKNAQGPLVITQRGRATAILLSIDAYERSQQENELLRLLATGEKEILDSKGHTLDSVLREADALLEGDES